MARDQIVRGGKTPAAGRGMGQGMGRTAATVMRLPMRVWDLPVRLIHWIITLSMAGSYFSYLFGYVQLHIWLGETTLGLLLYRLIWGFVGSETARFRKFLRSPLVGLRHLAAWRTVEVDNEIGHNAAGGWMVLILLGVIALQVGTGLFVHNRSGLGGPLAHLVAPATWHTARQLHGLFWNVLLGAVILHILTVASYYFLKKQNLVRPMITGKKRLPAAARAPRMASTARMLLVLAVVMGLVAFVVWGTGSL